VSDASARAVVQEDESEGRARRSFELGDTGFKEVPKRWRKFYRHWQGDGDELAPNEVICPVCKVVIRSHREFRPGDRVYCMPCMSRMIIVQRPDGSLEAEVTYS
jgi:rubredoxin